MSHTSYEDEYRQLADSLLNDLDFARLAHIRDTPLMDLSDEDLEIIGLSKRENDDVGAYYEARDERGIKIYFTRQQDHLEYRKFRFAVVGRVSSTSELLDIVLTNWRLKLTN